LKKALLTILAKQSKTSTLCIIPKHILPEIDSITDGWIYDLQLWDLSENDRQLVAQLRTLGICEDESASKMFQSIRAATGGRKALVAIGRQSQDKGLDVLMQFCGIAKEHWATVVAGKCPNATAKQTILEGHGLVIDRHIKREELLAAYAAADAVWCLYSPSYNQASGVLGRAIQLGIPAIVRSNSVSDEISEYCGASTIASTSAEHLFEALRCVGEVDPKIGREISNYLREQSITTLRHELTTQRKEISEKTS
jgi:hypothetical protein